MTGKEDEFSAIHLLQTSDPVIYGNLNKELQNGSYVGRGKYTNNSGGAYELMIRRSGRYQSIVNDGNGGGSVNSNGRGNQQNQRRNVILLHQEDNANGFSHED